MLRHPERAGTVIAAVVAVTACWLAGPLQAAQTPPQAGPSEKQLFASMQKSAQAHLNKWRPEEISRLVRTVEAVLRRGPRALTAQERADLAGAWEGRMAGWKEYDPGADKFAKRQTCVQASIQSLAWSLAAILERPAADDAQMRPIDAQIEQVARKTEALVRAGGGAEDAAITDSAQQFTTSLKQYARDILEPSMKRPLKEAELASLLAKAPALIADAKHRIEADTAFWERNQGFPEEQRRRELERIRKSACSSTFGAVQGAYYAALLPPVSPLLAKALQELSTQHEEEGKRWMDEQQAKMRADMVSGIVGKTPDQLDQSLMLLEVPFVLRSILDDDALPVYW